MKVGELDEVSAKKELCLPWWVGTSNSKTKKGVSMGGGKQATSNSPTGKGRDLFSLRAMAFSALCPEAVAATYSISRRLR